ncbi:hypothetical protein HAX54_038800, partial [Datura stramonium]|nr:hypothetical protein [Datura stramonium]
MRLEDMRAHGIGAFSSSTPRAKKHTTGVTVYTESETLLTPPPAIEDVLPNTMSVVVTIGVIIE